MFPKYLLPATLLLAVVRLGAADTADLPGVHNFHQVNAHVFRGAQPTDEGFQSLAKLGIKVVVDLQEPDSRGTAEANTVTADGMKYISVPMQGMATPSDTSVFKVLGLLEDSSVGPVFVHCHRGADRTGAVIACYRVEHDHWKNDKALSEARSFGMSWYQKALQSYVKGFAPRTLQASSGEPATLDAGVTAASLPGPAFIK